MPTYLLKINLQGESPQKKVMPEHSEEAQREPLIAPTPVSKSPTDGEVSQAGEQIL